MMHFAIVLAKQLNDTAISPNKKRNFLLFFENSKHLLLMELRQIRIAKA